MANTYTEYIKELLDYLYGLMEASSDGTSFEFEYYYSEYAPKVSQQLALLTELEKAGVIVLVSEIKSPNNLAAITKSFYGNSSPDVLDGYNVKVDKENFKQYRANSKLLNVTKDEHEYIGSHLSDDAKTLYVKGEQIDLSKSFKNMELMRLLFANDFRSISETDFAETGGEEALQNPKAYAKNVVDHLNTKVEKKTREANFLRREKGLIFLSEDL